jgi:hypothetical protein
VVLTYFLHQSVVYIISCTTDRFDKLYRPTSLVPHTKMQTIFTFLAINTLCRLVIKYLMFKKQICVFHTEILFWILTQFSLVVCCSMYFCCCSMYFLCFSMYFCVLCTVCFVTFPALFVCICVLNNCHRVATQLQLNISYHIISYHSSKQVLTFLTNKQPVLMVCHNHDGNSVPLNSDNPLPNYAVP